MASERLDSIGPEFEEYFDINQLDDDDDDNPTQPFSASAEAITRQHKDGKIDFYNKERLEKRPSNVSPNARG